MASNDVIGVDLVPLTPGLGSLGGTHETVLPASGGVLVKCAKPGQELRADLPAIGPATIEAAHSAGLSGVAVEAGRSFVLDHDETVRRADTAGLFVLGFAAEAGR